MQLKLKTASTLMRVDEIHELDKFASMYQVSRAAIIRGCIRFAMDRSRRKQFMDYLSANR